MFTPKNIKKYKHCHRAHIIQRISKSFIFPFLKTGVIGIKILKFGFLFPKQLTAAYNTLNKILKKKGSIYFFAFPNASLTKKKPGARMGKGKGKAKPLWVFKIMAGFILFEIHTSFISLAIKAIKIVQYKLPLVSKIVLNLFKAKNN